MPDALDQSTHLHFAIALPLVVSAGSADVERTVIEPVALRHTVPKTRLVPRVMVSPSGEQQIVLEQQTYESTELRVVDVPVTVVEQEEREVLATVWHMEQRVVPLSDTTGLRHRSTQSAPMRLVGDGEVIEERSLVAAPGSTNWRFENRAAEVSTSAWFHTPGT